MKTDKNITDSDYFNTKKDTKNINIINDPAETGNKVDDSVQTYNNETNNEADTSIEINDNEIDKKVDLNKLGNYELSDTMEHALYLYILYCNKFGYDPSMVANYIIENSINNSNSLFNSDDDFKKWVLINYNIRIACINHLEKMGIDLSSDSVIELYKGKLDSIMQNGNVISPYATTMNKENSVLYKKNNKIYKISGNNVEELEEGKTYIIQNPYSVAHLLYLLETLGNTNNRVIICFWGSLKDRCKNNSLSMMNDIIDFLNIKEEVKTKTKLEEKDGMYIYSFDIDTKNIKKDVEYSQLMTKKELEILGNSHKSNHKKGI